MPGAGVEELVPWNLTTTATEDRFNDFGTRTEQGGKAKLQSSNPSI